MTEIMTKTTEDLVMRLLNAVRGKRVFLCGNGGSAANAMHIANDLVSVGVAAHPLVADVATITAIANDFGYMHIFDRQIQVFGQPGDTLIALSGSGESLNIIRAINKAKAKGMTVFAIVGNFGKKTPKAALLATHAIIGGDNMQEAEEYQIQVGHRLMILLKALNGGKK